MRCLGRGCTRFGPGPNESLSPGAGRSSSFRLEVSGTFGQRVSGNSVSGSRRGGSVGPARRIPGRAVVGWEGEGGPPSDRRIGSRRDGRWHGQSQEETPLESERGPSQELFRVQLALDLTGPKTGSGADTRREEFTLSKGQMTKTKVKIDRSKDKKPRTSHRKLNSRH